MDFTLLADGREKRLDLDAELRAPLTEPSFGWVRKPHGWCRGDACIPAAAVRAAETPQDVDVIAFAELTGKVPGRRGSPTRRWSTPTGSWPSATT